MLQKFEIRGVHTKVDDNLHKYITKKIGRLDRYLSHHQQQSAHCEVILKEGKAKDKKQCTCEVIMHLPKENIMLKESTLNMYAAVDIVETKLKLQLKKYKDLHASGKFHRRMFARFSRQGA
ncbi:MAG TPA: ribosome-associated translation inhibitor RaiA [Patescibacteria group bacterium]|nr:ribosome-associated translation inhibitor RaiA [Patescibacteria group bacterium]